ncbi:MAG: phosphonate ABC transporter, permease protein PhnE [Rhodovarius sp.]|nr:phosphonate ABC transporter, permease protein PhnE [Rhodovarius sp.]MCX7931313.1 phosphonate ABC transporter, permease protein PhnE [Rhodovarius sp.]MDW8315834.1 phosphonate ABC transporter, permease protein PhnE [Rhodovarius sp.]
MMPRPDIAAWRARAPRAFAPPLARRLLAWSTGTAVLFGTLAALLWLDMTPQRILNGLSELLRVALLMLPPSPGERPMELVWAMLETLAMAFAGTFIAALLAVPLGFLAARNVLPLGPLRFGLRRFLDVLRGVDQLIWALIFVRAVGLGPLAGVLSIIVTDTGTLAKLYSESLENADRREIEGVRATGAGGVQTARFGLLPQALPLMLSHALYIFESNVRSSTILGIVGAGGIGFQLSDRIRALRWEEAAFIILMILVMVAVIDSISGALRRRLLASGR